MPVALYCEPDAYLVEGRTIVGRRAAGSALLRAAVNGRGNEPIVVYAGSRAGGQQIANAVKAIDPEAATRWIPLGRADMLARVGTVFRPDPALGSDARLRLRASTTAYSLCGITHTLSSIRVQEIITGYLSEPLMPWDAVICTSRAALGIVESLLDQALDYQRWRLGLQKLPPMPQFPIIPLGVHSADFAVTDATRNAARRSLGLADDETAVLFAGRLSFSTKAHPYPMYQALNMVAERTDKRIVLIQAGQSFTKEAGEAIRDASERFSPRVRHLFVDGADSAAYASAFRGADIFMSLSDSIQETFGITPVEAMASGLPVIVSDWNGYRDTVRDGVDGFRINSWAPMAGVGSDLAERVERGDIYEAYCANTSSAVSMDMVQLIERLTALVANPQLRQSMGRAGLDRVRSTYDWSVVYRLYQQLWAELGQRRQHAAAETMKPAPTAHPVYADPYRTFAHYPTETITGATIAHAAPSASSDQCAVLAAEPLFQHVMLPVDNAVRMFDALQTPRSISDVAQEIGLDTGAAIRLVGQLAKMNLLILRNPRGEPTG